MLSASLILADEQETRAKLRPKARMLLVRADARLEAEDHAGALQAYMEAVKADPAAADLQAIRRYAPPAFGPTSKTSKPSARIAAVRQFLEIHPGNAEAERDLVLILPHADAAAFVAELVTRRPRDPQLYRLRAGLRLREGRHMEALADLEYATTLDPENAELFYLVGVITNETVAKRADLSAQQKRDLIRRGFAALDRAESLRADYYDTLAWRSLLLREQAELESDPAIQRKLIEEADAMRQRSLDMATARPGNFDAGAGPFRVGGAVKAPVVRHRVEPVIPEAAREAGVSGIVIIEAVIDKQGRVRETRVLKALPYGLDKAAVAAVKQWIFEPGTVNGQPVDVYFNLTINIR